ncbi:MAG TPA: hypothetical protein VF952_20675 [Chloroflexia bacterium]|jgi:hypothetical protein
MKGLVSALIMIAVLVGLLFYLRIVNAAYHAYKIHEYVAMTLTMPTRNKYLGKDPDATKLNLLDIMMLAIEKNAYAINEKLSWTEAARRRLPVPDQRHASKQARVQCFSAPISHTWRADRGQVSVDRTSSKIDDIFVAARPVLPWPGAGCLQCHDLIPAAKLAQEALSEEEHQRQRYVDDDNVVQPSVITLNVLSAAHAVNDLMTMFTGLFRQGVSLQYQIGFVRARSMHCRTR